MPSRRKALGQTPSIESELYFLIERFLSAGPCREASVVLRRELQEHKLLPKRIDWEGEEHVRSYENLLELNRHIDSSHLLQICMRLGPLLDKEVKPSVCGVSSLLGAGSQSLLRTVEGLKNPKWPPSTHAVVRHQRAKLPPSNLMQPSLVHVLRGQEVCSQTHRNHILPCSMYTKVSLLSRTLGHLSAVYCVLFDRTGTFIFTGADDSLVKIWHTSDGRLKATLRGHASEITDMTINYENTLLASGSCDKTIRIWCLQTKAPVAVLQAHTASITSLQFCPQVKGDNRYLASTGGDGCVCFWEWNVQTNQFQSKPRKYVERSRAGAQMLCSSFSPGGMFLATGSADHVIRVYSISGVVPEKICELESHTDRVDSISYAHKSDRFVSGSRDGTARIWRFERQDWRAHVINVARTLKKDKRNNIDSDEKLPKLKVTMVGWTLDDTRIITAISDFTIKVWCSFTGELFHELQAHEDEVFVLERSPFDPRILLSAGHDGHVFIWNVFTGAKVKGFFNMIEGQGHGAVFDCKFSPDGKTFVATDSHGHLLMYSFGSNERHKKVPNEVFFHTDYRPVVRDANNFVLDEQTQMSPHLMPPPFLVDIDGNPYPPEFQRLVPGRERCTGNQLVPQLAVNEEGLNVVSGNPDSPPAPAPPPEPSPSHDSDETETEQEREEPEAGSSGQVPVTHRPSLDHMIEQLQRRQDQRNAHRHGPGPMGSPPPPPTLGSPRGVQRANSVSGNANAHMVGMRRVGETEGVRQSLGNIQQTTSTKEMAALKRHILVRPILRNALKCDEEERMSLGEEELQKFVAEKRRKPLVVQCYSDSDSCDSGSYMKTRKKKKSMLVKNQAHANEESGVNRLATRALYDTDEEWLSRYFQVEVEEEVAQESDIWDDDNEEQVRDSSDYSDWMCDTGSNLQPPKRRSTRRRRRRHYTTSENEEESDLDISIEQPTATKPAKKKQPQKQKKKKPRSQRSSKKSVSNDSMDQMDPDEVQNVLERFRPPDWLTDTIPRKTPYFPQMGDEVIYFRQGHELYVNAVSGRSVYHLDANKNQPWHKNPNLREQELVRIVGVKFEIHPPRLCCLKLAFIDAETGRPTGGSFSVKYHDMPDVIDFLVLRQNYDIAKKRNWKKGDRFRSMIDDAWWMGVIESQQPSHPEFPDSMFQCFKVKWDNGEIENLSPWDMEPIDEGRRLRLRNRQRVPDELGGGINVTQDELHALMYTPKPSEWPETGRDMACERIVGGLDVLMEHSVAEPFLTPVDLSVFPAYARHIEYPIDLSTIKARLESRFYRRITPLQFDLRYLETNALKFNEPRSQIIRSAKVLTETLLRFISDTECTDIMSILQTLSKGEEFQWDSNDSDSGETTEDYETQGVKRKSKSDDEATPARKRRKISGKSRTDPDAWKGDCTKLLETIFQCEDAAPFREPVDINQYPNYYEVVNHPIDLSNVRENMEVIRYTNPSVFCQDMRLIFSNSKFFNTNKRSRIYAMTLRLSAMFEEKMKDIILNWKSAVKHKKKSMNHFSPKQLGFSLRSGSNAGTSAETSLTSRPGTSGTSSLPFSRRTRGAHSSLTNGSSHCVTRQSSSEDSDVDVTSSVENSNRNNAARERRAAVQKRFTYNETDDSETEIDEDHTEDYKVRQRKSPTKKSISKGKRPAVVSKKTKSPSKKHTNGKAGLRGTSSASSGYHTRASTGSIKRRRYNPEGSFTDLDEEQQQQQSDSDTEVEEKYVRPQMPRKLKNITVKFNKNNNSPIKEERLSASGSNSSSGSDSGSNTEDVTTGDSSSSDTEDLGSQEISKAASSSSHKHGSRARTKEKHHKHHKSAHYAAGSNISNNSTSTGTNIVRSTRFQGKRTIAYQEETDEDNDSSEEPISVSSRGRIRKMTPRARASILGE